jgi:hypothetical protein
MPTKTVLVLLTGGPKKQNVNATMIVQTMQDKSISTIVAPAARTSVESLDCVTEKKERKKN